MITLPAGTEFSDGHTTFRTDRPVQFEDGMRDAIITACEVGGSGHTIWVRVTLDKFGQVTTDPPSWEERLRAKPPLEKRAKHDQETAVA